MKVQDFINNPLTLVIFGATGDLYQKKLAGALFKLFSSGLLPEYFTIIGFARRPLSDTDFSNFTRDAVLNGNKNSDRVRLDEFLGHIKYVQGDLENLESFQNLSIFLGTLDKGKGICSNKLFYLAIPPTLYNVVFKNISNAGLSVPCASGLGEAWARILVEKPFGSDIEEAKKLDHLLGELFHESQVFRIDHYLAKETIHNFIDFRFLDRALELKWNNKNIDKVRIVVCESNDAHSRGFFYDGVGALLDVGQNHLLQMLALTAMEEPKNNTATEIHLQRLNVLKKTNLLDNENFTRGQYEGYQKEEGVKENSQTETFLRFGLEVENERWKGVYFELETGKALDGKNFFIEVCFKKSKACLRFPTTEDAKNTHDAYEKVFYDCLSGDQTIFVSTAEIMEEWRITSDIIKKWQEVPMIIYKKGSKAEDIN